MSYKARCVVVTHHKPDFDEVLAYYLLREYGQRAYTAIDTRQAVLEFQKSDYHYVTNQSVAYFLIGIEGSAFDEHPRDGVTLHEGECAATLMAKELQIERFPELQPMLQYALQTDLQGDQNAFTLSRLLKTAYKTMEPQQSIDVCLQLIHAQVTANRARILHERNVPLIISDKRLQVGDRSIRVVQLKDDVGISQRLRNESDIQILHRTPGKKLGTVQIYAKPGTPCMCDVAVRLRRAEGLKKWDHSPSNWEKVVAVSGAPRSMPEWHYFSKTGAVTNGTEKYPDIQATRLSPENIWDAVWLAITEA